MSAILTERELRKRGALDADEQIIEWKLGKILRLTLGGRDQPVPGADQRALPKQIRSLSGCCYSQRKLFFGSKASLYGDLAVVWHVDSADKVLRVVIATEQQPVVVWWRSGENENAEAVAEFADRIKAQRRTRLAELPLERRQGIEEQIARLAAVRCWSAFSPSPGQPHVSPSEPALPIPSPASGERGAAMPKEELESHAVRRPPNLKSVIC